MMTPQEVANCTFAKSVVGGYNMTSVDDFLDKLTEDYSALYKENAALKAKLKMTVDKMTEYRESEDAIRSTLIAAQKMSTTMISEAEQKREQIIHDATITAKARVADLQKQIADEETRLEAIRFQVDQDLETERKRLIAGQEQLRVFIENVRAVCNEELAQLDLLPDLPVEEPKPAPPVQAAPPAQAAPEPAAEEQAAPAPVAEEKEEVQDLSLLMSAFAAADMAEKKGAAGADPLTEDELEDPAPTKVLNLDDLQFGPNYTKD